MSLSPKARALIDSSRKALRGTSADRERVEAALRARLGPAALPPEGGVTRLVGRSGYKAASLTVSLCVLGAAAFMATRPAGTMEPRARHSAQPAAPAPEPASMERAAPPSAAAASASTAPTAKAPRPSGGSTVPKRRDRLAEEVELLSRATVELRTGNAHGALEALEEHQRKFPMGTLTEERRAAMALALCALARVREGRAQLAALAPNSPAVARAQQACGSDAEALR